MAKDKKMRKRQVESGVVIYREGDGADAVFILQKVEVEITRKSGEEDVRLGVLRDGAIFGKMGVLRNKPRSTTLRTLSEVSMITVAKADFMAAFGTEQSLALQLLPLLCERLSKANQYIVDHPDLATGAEFDQTEKIVLLPASPLVETQNGLKGIDITALPFRIGCHALADHRTSVSATELLLRSPDNCQIAHSHLVVETHDGQVMLRDLGSHLGTLVNGVRLAQFEPLDRIALKYGENEVQLGSIESPLCFRIIVERASRRPAARLALPMHCDMQMPGRPEARA